MYPMPLRLRASTSDLRAGDVAFCVYREGGTLECMLA